MLRVLAVVLVMASTALAAAQPPVPRSGATPPPGVGPQLRRPVSNPPLTRQEAETLRHRLQESLARQAAAAPRDTALREAGLPEASDAVERASRARRARKVGPLEIGLATAAPPHPKDAVDPGLAATARLGLLARLGREPSAAEITEETKAFDARVESANRWLAANRGRIAKAYASAGGIPPSFDDAALDAAPARPTGSPEARDGFRAVFRALLTQPETAGAPTPDPPSVVPRVPRGTAPRTPASPAPRDR
jgi:hypothetical protein